MSPFESIEPASPGEALGLLDPDDRDVRPIGGGTASMLMMKSGLYRPRRLISPRRVADGVSDIRVTADGGLEIGAMVRLEPVQQAFIESGAFQCGFCTPVFILMTRLLLDENPAPDGAAIRHYLSGNRCRCGAYPRIIEAVKLAAHKRSMGGGGSG